MQRETRNQPRDELMSQLLSKCNPTCKFGKGHKEERRKTKVAHHHSSRGGRLYVGLGQLTCPGGQAGGGEAEELLVIRRPVSV